MTGQHKVQSYCRICSGGCGVKVAVENDRVVEVRADPDHPMSRGYACFKGLQAPESHYGSRRLLHPLKRGDDGVSHPISSSAALDEIGNRLNGIIERHGPNSAALFCGNGAMGNYVTFAMQRDFMNAIESCQRFTTFTIDQSAKFVSFERLGGWAGGTQELEDSDVLLIFGSNPLVSHVAGKLGVDPVKRLKDARKRNMALIVVDPRLTETARHADVFLQPLPGQDVAIAGAMLRLILEEGWHDADFCARFVGAERMQRLRSAVEPCTLDFAARRAGLSGDDIRAATRLFADTHRRGMAVTATGPNFAPFSNLAQHLVDCLNVVCGRFPRAGDRVRACDVLDPPAGHFEEVIPAPRTWEAFPPSRIRGVGMLQGERLTGTLADEILTQGPGQIRALIVSGGNPANSIPDQEKIVRALRSLDLLVVIDPHFNVTASLADYVLAPTLMYERPDLPFSVPGMAFWPCNWSQYTPAIVPAPADSDVIDDWQALLSIAHRLGKTVHFDGTLPLPPGSEPTADELIAVRARRAAVPLDEIKSHPGGKIFEWGDIEVQAGRPGNGALFDVMPDDVAAELEQALAQERSSRFPHLLASRRMRDLFNSNGYYLGPTRERNPFNPASLNPDEMAEMGIAEGDEVEIISDNGRIRAIAKGDPTLRRGVVTLTQGFGQLPGDQASLREAGTCINPLISDNRDVEAVNAMPRMTAVPIRIERVARADATVG